MNETTILFTREGKEYKGKYDVDGKKRSITTKQVCPKCGGRGYGPWFKDGGICYRCGGTGDGGWKVERLYTAEELAKLNERAEAKRLANAEKKARKLSERLKSIRAEFGQLIDEATKLKSENDFIADVLDRINTYGKVSDKQIEALKIAVAKTKEWLAKKAAKGEAPSGKVHVVAKILSTKTVRSMYGSQFKMLAELDNGATVWGTFPNKLFDLIEGELKGAAIEFDADFEPVKGDATHAFFKRPTKVKVAKRNKGEQLIIS